MNATKPVSEPPHASNWQTTRDACFEYCGDAWCAYPWCQCERRAEFELASDTRPKGTPDSSDPNPMTAHLEQGEAA